MATQIAPEVDILRSEVQKKYAELASNPERTFHFNHGLHLAKMLDYPEDILSILPRKPWSLLLDWAIRFSVGEIAEVRRC